MKKLRHYVNNKFLNKRNLEYQANVLENIALFLNRGYSLYDTINLLQYRYQLQTVLEELEDGEFISTILKKQNYDKDILLVIEIAEQSGDILLGINNAYHIIKQKIRNKEEIKKLLKYPLLLCIITIFALGFVALFLIPQFEDIYENFGLTKEPLILFLFQFIKNLPLILLILLIVGVILYYLFNQKSDIDKMNFCLKYRFIRKYYLTLYNHIFTINLVNLLKVGLKIDEIFLILAKQEYNILLQQESKRILRLLEDGYQLYECLNNQYYIKELKIIIKEGETFTTLLHNLDNYLVFLQQNQVAKTKQMFFLIQPIFYGFFGLLIVLLYGSIFMPMFQMMNNI